MIDASSPIGIFDSGFGGLSAMRALRQVLPYESIIYFGDTARLPYGNKSPDTIIRYCLENTAFLQTQGIKLLIIACHTACTAALAHLRCHCDIPIIGIIEQAIEDTIQATKTNKIAVLGTRATIASQVYQQEIQRKRPTATVYPIACPLFVPLVEEGFANHPFSRLIIQEYLTPIKQADVDTVLLGCTHYPLLIQQIQEELGDNVRLIDPAIGSAARTLKLLSAHALLHPRETPSTYQFYVSDDPEKFRHLGPTFLHYPIEHVTLVSHMTSSVSS